MFLECGGDRCPKGGTHQWDGPEKTWKTGSAATCSKCGLDAMSHTLMNDVSPEWPPTRLERVDTFVAVHLLREDGTSWCSMTKRHGEVSAWPVTDQGSTNPEAATCKACLGRHHRAHRA